jgi:subtilisin family serine protease
MRRRFTVIFASVLLAAVGLATSTSWGGSGQARAGTMETYIVLYRQEALPADTESRINRAGGVLVVAYGQIGVAIARSDSPSFRTALLRDSRIDGVAATTGFGVKPFDDAAVDDQGGGGHQGDLGDTPATDTDNLSGLQWDMRQIKSPQAHAITGGSRQVVVGDIDTGLDFTHEDLAPNYDAANSADCSSGAPTPLLPGNDQNGHGTHTAGTIAAASNGTGIVGVAPNVRIAGIKGSNDDGFFFPEMVVCSFMWAGMRHLDVTNNSYFADPYLYNCRNDPVQRAIWKAEQRAIRFAMTQGVTVVASAGNESDDLSHPSVDVISPDFPPGSAEEREVTNACVRIPVEIPGVIGVSAVGNRLQDATDPDDGYLKSFYSDYGVSAIEVTAPGGDSVFGITAEAPNGRVLSTYPSYRPCTRTVFDPTTGAKYCYLQGTSMAGPHVAGVAALIISRFGDSKNPDKGHMRPGRVAAHIQQTADPQPCPDALPTGYAAFTTPSGEPQECQGGSGHNSWYGNGQVNALNAVTKASGANP